LENFIIRRLKENDADDINRILRSITKDSATLDYKPLIKKRLKKGRN